jgi:hypothetical protein
MAEILQLFSVIRRLYQPDVLPFAQLQTPSALQRLRDRYAFAQVVPGPAQLLATTGEFSQAGQTAAAPVQQLSIGSNVIEFQMAAETAVAERFYEDLVKFLQELSGRRERQFPEYGRSNQTIAIVTLDVPAEAVFSEKMREYLSQAAPAFRTDRVEPRLQLTHLQWTVSYTKSDPDVEYIPKLFTIEPRSGSRAGDKVYFTQSPTDSETHRKLLEQFEHMLK